MLMALDGSFIALEQSPRDAQCLTERNMENEVLNVALFPKSRGIQNLT